MQSRWHKLLNLLLLARLEQVFSAISNIWLMVFIAWQLEPGLGNRPPLPEDAVSLPQALALGTAVAAGMAIYGIALNDALDVRHDRAFSPARPLAAGAIGPRTAIGLAVLGLLSAVLGSLFLGVRSAVLCVLAALAVLFFNTTARFFPAIGIVTVGLIRALIMFIPYPWVTFAWPIWLTMTHVMATATVVHVLEGKRPRMHAGDGWGLCAGWAFWTLALVSWMTWREENVPGLAHVRPGIWIGLAVSLFAAVSVFTLAGRLRPMRSRRAAGAAFAQVAVLWLMFYDVVWMAALRMWWQAAALAALLLLAWGTGRVIGVLNRLSVPPPGYQVGVDPHAAR